MKTMKTMKTMKYLLIASFAFTIVSCSDDTNNPIYDTFEDGLFVVNEGNYGTPNASLSFIDENNRVYNNIFENRNGFPLGDQAQSITTIDEKAYIVVSNSNKVVVAKSKNMEYITEISENITTPRYMTQVSEGKAYLSEWGADVVHVIDLNNNEIIKSISVGQDPEEIVVSNGFAYVCNSGNSWGSIDNTVSVIDISTDEVIKTLTLNDKPTTATVDGQGNVWVICKGNTVYDLNTWEIISQTAGSLSYIDGITKEIKKQFIFENNPSLGGLICDYSNLYFQVNQSIVSMSVFSSELDTNHIASGNFYGQFGMYDNSIYAADAKDYSQAGDVYKYTKDGVLLNTYQVGIIPGNFGF